MLFFHNCFITFEIPRALETYRTLHGKTPLCKPNSGRVVFFQHTKSGWAGKEKSFTVFDNLSPNE